MSISQPLPDLSEDNDFDSVARKLGSYISKVINKSTTFDALREVHGKILEPLSGQLTSHRGNTALIAVLLALKGYFLAQDQEDVEGLNDTRGLVCEYLAIRCTKRLSYWDLIDQLLSDIPQTLGSGVSGSRNQSSAQSSAETSPLLGYGSQRSTAGSFNDHGPPGREAGGTGTAVPGDSGFGLSEQLQGLNALEIAAVTSAKKFLSTPSIQRIVTAIWDGDIIFWSSLSADATKHAQLYVEQGADLFSRLRVPKYLKAFEVVFFAGFLFLYYAVLIQRSFGQITAAEVFLYIWLASFAYNELGEYWDAGSAFYLSDFWTLWDLAIVCDGFAFLICRVVGLTRKDQSIDDLAFDILAIDALFLVPRIFSLLSLHPYYGTLLPCLRDMTKDFIKFLSLVIILYVGFLTTFSLLARDHFSFRTMSWILVKVFFGSSYLGFDIADRISPVLGPILMLIFVCLTNVLLITSLISILSNSLTKVIEHAGDEYRYVYSVFVLEAAAGNRLTYFLPPLNLIPLFLRPLRLVLPTERLRSMRIALLKATHFPHVAAIQGYEYFRQRIYGSRARELPTLAASTPLRRQALHRLSRGDRLSLLRPVTAPSLGKAMAVDGAERRRGGGDEETHEALDDLKKQVARLSEQIELLSSRL